MAKTPLNKKKSINDLSLNPMEFFRISLSSIRKFVKPKALAIYRQYDMETDDFRKWDEGV